MPGPHSPFTASDCFPAGARLGAGQRRIARDDDLGVGAHGERLVGLIDEQADHAVAEVVDAFGALDGARPDFELVRDHLLPAASRAEVRWAICRLLLTCDEYL